MRLIFSPEAKLELEEAERYYNRQEPGLGERLRKEVALALPLIRAWPLSCPTEHGDIRRLTLSRFPYNCFTRWKPIISTLLPLPPSIVEPNFWIGRIDPP